MTCERCEAEQHERCVELHNVRCECACRHELADRPARAEVVALVVFGRVIDLPQWLRWRS